MLGGGSHGDPVGGDIGVVQREEETQPRSRIRDRSRDSDSKREEREEKPVDALF